MYIFTHASKLLNATCTVVTRLDWALPKNTPHRQEDKVKESDKRKTSIIPLHYAMLTS